MGKKSRKKNRSNVEQQSSSGEQQSSGDKKSRGKSKGKFPIVPVLIVLAVVIGIGIFTFNGEEVSAELTMADMPALKGHETGSVLNPSRFTGKTAAAYSVAQKHPEVLDHMYCYCNCKRSIGHKSLLSCFTDGHAAGCGICQDQAFFASSLADKGQDLAQIRSAMDRKFWQPMR